MKYFKKSIMFLMSLFLVLGLSSNPVFANDSISDNSEIIESVLIYNATSNSETKEHRHISLKRGSRPKKWIVYDKKVTAKEWTDKSKLLMVVKAVNGSTVTASASARKSGTWSANVNISKGILSSSFGYNVTDSFEISGSATGKIPKGYKLGTARAYPVYKKTSFKVKLVHAYMPTHIYKKGHGEVRKPIGIEIVFSYKKK